MEESEWDDDEWTAINILKRAVNNVVNDMIHGNSEVEWDRQVKLIYCDTVVMGKLISLTEDSDCAVVELESTGLRVEISAKAIISSLSSAMGINS